MVLYDLNIITWKKFPPDIFLCSHKTLGIIKVRCDRMSLSKGMMPKRGSQAGAPFFFMSYALKLLIVLTKDSLHFALVYALVAIWLHFFQKASLL